MSAVREHVSKVSDKQRRINQVQLHADIVAGLVDPGPPARHGPIVDRRDKRDPSVLGLAMEMARLEPWAAAYTACELAMEVAEGGVSDYPSDHSTVTETVRAYQDELEARAAQGDKYAISMLTTGQPGDSDE